MSAEISKQFVAVRAVIVRDGKILIIRESDKYKTGSQHGHYDFPGGKIKVGENIEDALKREVREEAGLEIKIVKPFFVCNWRPTINDEQIQIIGIFYLCQSVGETVKLGPDHDDFHWIEPHYRSYPLIKEKIMALEAMIDQNLV